jgi:hypothetical protein
VWDRFRNVCTHIHTRKELRRVEGSTHTDSVSLSFKRIWKRPVRIMKTATEVWKAELRSSHVTETSTNQAAHKLTSFKKFSKLKLLAYILQGSDGINQTWLNFQKSSLHNEPNNGSNSLINVTLVYRMCCRRVKPGYGSTSCISHVIQKGVQSLPSTGTSLGSPTSNCLPSAPRATQRPVMHATVR